MDFAQAEAAGTKGRWVLTKVARWCALGLGILACLLAEGSASATRDGAESVEDTVLAVSAEMTKAAEAVDADRLFGYMLETDKGSVVQNGIVMATRQEALERVRSNLRGISRIQYRWKRQYVSVLSAEVAVLTSEGESTATTTAGDSFTIPFAQTVVFVRKADGWRAIHAHQSSPLRP
jgi:ketosteroid isomerase-like protein